MTQIDLARSHPQTIKELADLLKRTNKKRPKPEDVKALQRFLIDHPTLWAFVGNLTEQTARQLINHTQSSPALAESLQTGYHQMQQDLGAAASAPLERLLIEQIALAWLRLGLVEYQYMTQHQQSLSLEQSRYWESRLNAAQRRFLRACETLARVRRLQLPALQLNIGQQQINQTNPP